jgi:hypothetical protein
VNDCPYFFVTQKASGRGYDLSWMFAAYVNEDHPLVDEVLKIALSTGVVRSFDGYQSRDIDQVRTQVRAVWTALSLMGIRYSSITASASWPDTHPFRGNAFPRARARALALPIRAGTPRNAPFSAVSPARRAPMRSNAAGLSAARSRCPARAFLVSEAAPCGLPQHSTYAGWRACGASA